MLIMVFSYVYQVPSVCSTRKHRQVQGQEFRAQVQKCPAEFPQKMMQKYIFLMMASSVPADHFVLTMFMSVSHKIAARKNYLFYKKK